MQPISPNYNWANGVKQIKITDGNLSQRCILSQIAKGKGPSTRGKMHQTFVLFLPLFTLHLLSGCDLFNMSCLSQISLMASLDILCSNPLNLKNKITKIEHKKIFCATSNILTNISWPINNCLRYFMTPAKPCAFPPSYILNVWSLYNIEYQHFLNIFLDILNKQAPINYATDS